MKLQHKLVTGLLVILGLFSIAGYISIRTSQSALQESIGRSSTVLASEVMDKIDREIYHRINEFQAYTKDLILQETLRASNRSFEKMNDRQGFITKQDREWKSVPQDELTPFMHDLIQNRLSEELREKIEYHESTSGYKVYGEVFITNKYGANIAQTGKTDDYKQDDEEWWQVAQKEGLYVGDLAYDASARLYSISYGISINDEAGNFMGAMKVVLNIKDVVRIINYLKLSGIHQEHRSMQYKLITQSGKIIYSTEEFEFLEDVSPLLALPMARKSKPSHENHFVINQQGKNEKLISHVHSRGYKDYKGLSWVLLIEHDTDEIFAPVEKLRAYLVIILAAVILLVIIIGFIMSVFVVRPIEKLQNATNEISEGNLDVHIENRSTDEVGHLASAFNHMAGELKKNTHYMNRVNEDLSALYKVSSAISEVVDMDKLFHTILTTLTTLEIFASSEKFVGCFRNG